MKSLGQIAFEAWREALNRQLIEHGARESLRMCVGTEFEELTFVLQAAWEAAAVAVTKRSAPVIH